MPVVEVCGLLEYRIQRIGIRYSVDWEDDAEERHGS